MKSTFLLLFSLLILQGSVSAQTDSLNVNKVGNLTYFPFLSDVWGYVDSTGNEWALVGTAYGLSIVDLADPTNPTEAFFLPGDTTGWRDIKTWGNFAYVSGEHNAALQIVDLSDLPNSVNYKDTVIGGIHSIHNIWIDEFGYLYTTGDNINNGYAILNLNPDPWNPFIVSTYTSAYVHDIFVRNNLAYHAELYEGELAIVDVSDKSNLTTLGSKTYVNAATHSTWLDSLGTICFTADEADGGWIYAWDVSDPANIELLDGIQSQIDTGVVTVSAPHNVTWHDGFLFNSYYRDGLQIVDAHRPENLVEVGHYDTFGGLGTFSGLWGVYPFLPSGLILGTDINNGLFVFDFNFTRASYLEGQATDAATTFPLSNVNIDILSTPATDLTTTFGNYATGVADSGMFMVQATKFGYFPSDTTLLLAPGQVAIWNPRMIKIPGVGLTIRVEDSLTGLPIPGVQIRTDTIGFLSSYTTNSAGEVSDPNFLAGTYDIGVAIWGYEFKSLLIPIDSLSNNLVIKLVPGYQDNFAFDLGWTTSATASQGFWVRDVPLGTYYSVTVAVNPDFDVQDDWGKQCYVTGNSTTNIDDDDVDDGTVMLSSPVMDLRGYSDPHIFFDWWLVTRIGGSSTSFLDSMVVDISTGSGVYTVWGKGRNIPPGWTRNSIRLLDYLTPDSLVQFHVRVNDTISEHRVEGGLDFFRVVNAPPTAVNPIDPAQSRLEVYPNPSGGEFRIRYDLGMLTEGVFQLLDLNGHEIRRIPLDASSGTLQFADPLPQGMYIGVLESQGKRLSTAKILRY